MLYARSHTGSLWLLCSTCVFCQLPVLVVLLLLPWQNCCWHVWKYRLTVTVSIGHSESCESVWLRVPRQPTYRTHLCHVSPRTKVTRLLEWTWRHRADFNGEELPFHHVKISRGKAYSEARSAIVTCPDLDGARFLFGLSEGTKVRVARDIDPSGARYATTYWFVPRGYTRTGRRDVDGNIEV